MTDGPDPVEFANVYVVDASPFMLTCRIGNRVVAVRPRNVLPGSDIKEKGDRGSLVLTRGIAVSLGLA